MVEAPQYCPIREPEAHFSLVNKQAENDDPSHRDRK